MVINGVDCQNPHGAAYSPLSGSAGNVRADILFCI